MSGALGKCSPTRWLRLLGFNPSGEVALANTLCLSLLFPNDREVALAKSLEARSPVSGAVPSSEHRANLERQAERLSQYCTARGYQVAMVVKEIGSGVNDSRPKLLSLLKDSSITRVVVEHRDRLTRFGFHYIDALFAIQGRVIEVVNPAENDKEELLADLASIIYSFCARLYGQRRAKRKTEKLVEQLQAPEEEKS
jgi:putative resolvase